MEQSTFLLSDYRQGGQTKNRLETDTRTKVVIDKKGLEVDMIVTAGDRRGVAAGADMINVIVAAARNTNWGC